MKKKIILTIVLVILCSGILGKSFVYAINRGKVKEYAEFYRYYKSVQIKEGDTLWSLAKEYNQNSGLKTDAYIRILRSINGLKHNTIHEDQYITIVYFSKDYK